MEVEGINGESQLEKEAFDLRKKNQLCHNEQKKKKIQTAETAGMRCLGDGPFEE